MTVFSIKSIVYLVNGCMHSNYYNIEAHIGGQIHISTTLDETSDNFNSTLLRGYIQRCLLAL